MVQLQRRINVKIPPGVDTGSQLILRGEGDAPNGGGQKGDLYVVINVMPHQVFQREDNDLVCHVDVLLSKAMLGGEVEVPTLDGPARILMPPGTQSGAVFRLRKKGMPGLRFSGRGDELVVIRVKIPAKLSQRQRDLIEQLSKEGL